MKEKYNRNVNLDGWNAAAMDLITGYIYTARVEITKENAFALLSASDYLQIDGEILLIVVLCIAESGICVVYATATATDQMLMIAEKSSSSKAKV